MRDAIEKAAEALVALVTRRRTACLLLFSVAYLVTFGVRAAHRAFWFDELFTYYLTIQPTTADIVQSLADRIDQQPLPYYLLHRVLLVAAEGNDPLLLLRLPELLGVLLAFLCLFEFVRRRTSDVAGWIAVLLLLNTEAIRYADEARPYGLVLGLSSLALVAYQRATEENRSGWWIVLLSLSLFAAVSSSYYAVLLFFPLALAELYRAWSLRRIDWKMGMGLFFAAGLSAAYAPSAMDNVSHFNAVNWAAPNPTRLFAAIDLLLGKLPLCAACLTIAWGVWMALWRRTPDADEPRRTQTMPPADLLLAVGLSLLPIVIYVVAELVTHKFHGRYVISAALGFSILGAYGLTYRLRRGDALLSVGAIAILLAVFSVVQLPLVIGIARAQPRVTALAGWLRDQPETLPVAVDNPLSNLEIGHQNPGGIRDRLYYVIDVENAQRLAPAIVNGGANWFTSQKLMPVQAVARAEFLAEHPTFLLYRDRGDYSYLLRLAQEEGADVRLLRINAIGTESLFLVSYASSDAGSTPTESSTK